MHNFVRVLINLSSSNLCPRELEVSVTPSVYYTDGVIDTSNSLGKRFDEERLIKTLTKLCKQSYTSQEILNKIFKKLDDFTGQDRHLEDDASMVVFQLK